MKSYVAVAFIAIVAAAQAVTLEEQKAIATQILGECRQQFQVSDEVIAKVRSGDLSAATEESKCLTNCFMEKAGVLNNGVFNKENALKQTPVDLGTAKAKEIVDLCGNEGGANNCEKAFNIYACLQKNKAAIL